MNLSTTPILFYLPIKTDTQNVFRISTQTALQSYDSWHKRCSLGHIRMTPPPPKVTPLVTSPHTLDPTIYIPFRSSRGYFSHGHHLFTKNTQVSHDLPCQSPVASPALLFIISNKSSGRWNFTAQNCFTKCNLKKLFQNKIELGLVVQKIPFYLSYQYSAFYSYFINRNNIFK